MWFNNVVFPFFDHGGIHVLFYVMNRGAQFEEVRERETVEAPVKGGRVAFFL